MAEGSANAIYGVYNAMVYLMALPGGWIADRLVGAAAGRAGRRHRDRLRALRHGDPHRLERSSPA